MTNKFETITTEDLEERLSSLQLYIFETRCQLECEYGLEGLGSWHIQKTDKDFEQDREVAQMKYILKERYASEGLDEFGREPRNFCEYPNPLPF